MTRKSVGSRSPEEVTKTLDRVAELVPKLIREVQEAHAYGFDRKDRRHFEDNHEAKPPDRISNPTEEIALDQAHTRKQVQHAFGLIVKAEQELFSAYSRLGRVFVSEYVPLREQLRAGDQTPRNVKRDLEERERYLSSALSEVRQRLREAG